MAPLEDLLTLPEGTLNDLAHGDEDDFIHRVDDHDRAFICDRDVDPTAFAQMLRPVMGDAVSALELDELDGDNPMNEVLEDLSLMLGDAGWALLMTASKGDSYDCFVVENDQVEAVIEACDVRGLEIGVFQGG